jgi:hypothetical protein
MPIVELVPVFEAASPTSDYCCEGIMPADTGKAPDARGPEDAAIRGAGVEMSGIARGVPVRARAPGRLSGFSVMETAILRRRANGGPGQRKKRADA